MDNLTQLYPQPARQLPLEDVYLEHDLRQYAEKSGKVFVYSNFVASVDGRIAIPRADGKGMRVPSAVANDRDWRLYQELAAQADILISSSRYLRDWAEGKAQEILQVNDPKFADLGDWRKQRGLSAQADIAVVSHKLNFPIPDVLTANGRKVVIFTTEQADPKQIERIESDAIRVVVAGTDEIDGKEMVAQLGKRGYHTVYSGAGPQVMHLLLKAKVLDRLYLTYANRLLGGEPFSSIVEGDLFDPPVDLKLSTLYFDPAGLDGLGQLFASYERA